jgi:hypothetical protein
VESIFIYIYNFITLNVLLCIYIYIYAFLCLHVYMYYSHTYMQCVRSFFTHSPTSLKGGGPMVMFITPFPSAPVWGSGICSE